MRALIAQPEGEHSPGESPSTMPPAFAPSRVFAASSACKLTWQGSQLRQLLLHRAAVCYVKQQNGISWRGCNRGRHSSGASSRN